MNTSLVFVDTAFFKAFVDTKDEFHDQAVKIMGRIEREDMDMITSNFIIDETATLIRKRCGLERVGQWVQIFQSERMHIERITVNQEKEAWEWFKNNWSGLSFTDCTSFAVMKELEIGQVATFDNHFQQAGFEMLQ